MLFAYMSQNNPYPTKKYIRFLTFIVFSIFIIRYRIRKKLPDEVTNLKSPYLLLCNHVGFWDPFIAGHFLPHFTHFVSSDAAFRNRFFRFFLTRLGTIPKKKNIRDTKVIRDIIAVINSGENVGIFPEAVRTWSGLSLNIDPSIIKLIKLLNVNVVICTLKGMNLFNPRWSKKLRKTKVVAEYKLLIKDTEIKRLSGDEIYNLLTKSLFHDEVEYQKTNMNKINSDNKAEHISHALFVCPECFTIDSFRANGNEFECNTCCYSMHINEFGFFVRRGEGNLFFNNIRDWFQWQQEWMITHINKKLDSNFTGVIFEDINSNIFNSQSGYELKFMGIADVRLFADRIEIDYKDKDKDEKTFLYLNQLQTINPQVNEMLEIYYNDKAYRVTGNRDGVSALKWEVAVNSIWKRNGENSKLSSYLFQH